MSLFTAILERFADLIFPKGKLISELEEYDSASLRHTLPFPENPNGSCNATPVISLFGYGDTRVRALIWEMKYRRNSRLMEKTAELLHDLMLESAGDLDMFEEGRPILVPIPISKERFRERGWNQSDLIARRIREHAPDSYDFVPDALKKIRHTAPQTSLKRAERLKNLKGCFAVPDLSAVRGRTVFLIDDVTTTGATIAEARRTLLEAGAKDVRAFTIAH